MKKMIALCLLALLVWPRPCGDPADDVYLISSFEDLLFFARESNEGRLPDIQVRLTADIDASAPLPCIGSLNNMFSGTFDGQGHTIRGLMSFSPLCGGLFAYIAPQGIVKNLTLDHALIAGSQYTGGIAGYCAGRIENCLVSNSIIANYSHEPYGTACGSICGLSSGSVIDCAAVNICVSGQSDVGGLCGKANGGTLEKGIATGSCLCTGMGDVPCGGLIGSVHSSARVTDSISCVSVSADFSDYCGGLAGGAFGGSVSQCSFLGTLNSSGRYVGAVAGWAGSRAQLAACRFDPLLLLPVTGYGPCTALPLPRLRADTNNLLEKIALKRFLRKASENTVSPLHSENPKEI